MQSLQGRGDLKYPFRLVLNRCHLSVMCSICRLLGHGRSTVNGARHTVSGTSFKWDHINVNMRAHLRLGYHLSASTHMADYNPGVGESRRGPFGKTIPPVL